ncbi:hypothetical protein L1S32_06985 [Methanogenium sp. S4BF]|uniref:hypothetical protein n=1 Tax=Methanogenium sp. S4BF TaxID=1789226 RepID=UPI002416D951|nr:hypothetical protein [Methanogenium sp. S4BF]WFN33595.1 hypothetical protein L1S32_06985 [Methanogenium sp. S4BF]
MKIRSKTLLAGLVVGLCLCAFIISPVSASGMGKGAGNGAGNGSAAESTGMCAGDCDKTRDQTCTQTCDQTCNQTCNQTCDRIMGGRTAMPDAGGIGMTEIRAALASGDMETIGAMLGELRGACMQNGILNCFTNGFGPGYGSGAESSGMASSE